MEPSSLRGIRRSFNAVQSFDMAEILRQSRFAPMPEVSLKIESPGMLMATTMPLFVLQEYLGLRLLNEIGVRQPYWSFPVCRLQCAVYLPAIKSRDRRRVFRLFFLSIYPSVSTSLSAKSFEQLFSTCDSSRGCTVSFSALCGIRSKDCDICQLAEYTVWRDETTFSSYTIGSWVGAIHLPACPVRLDLSVIGRGRRYQ